MRTAQRWRRLSTLRWPPPLTRAFRSRAFSVRSCAAPRSSSLCRVAGSTVCFALAAVTVAVLPGGTMLVDPTALEEQVSASNGCRSGSLLADSRHLQEARGVVTFALLERVKASLEPSGEGFADDVVLSSVSGKLSGALAVAGGSRACSAHVPHPQLSNCLWLWTRHGALSTR